MSGSCCEGSATTKHTCPRSSSFRVGDLHPREATGEQLLWAAFPHQAPDASPQEAAGQSPGHKQQVFWGCSTARGSHLTSCSASHSLNAPSSRHQVSPSGGMW